VRILQGEKAYYKIRDAITYGELKPGERLVEERICKDFDIGRTPLREAIRQLQAEGYLNITPNKGSIVSKLSIKEVEEIHNLVAFLEGYATETATKYIGRKEKEELRLIMNEARKAGLRNDYRKWLEKNALFHDYFVKMSGNIHLLNIVKGLRNRIYRYRLISVKIPGCIEEYIRWHDKIMRFVIDEAPNQAGRAMRAHVLYVKDALVEFLSKYPML
jgi:DNA-binding GntR family transcriptional regulator